MNPFFLPRRTVGLSGLLTLLGAVAMGTVLAGCKSKPEYQPTGPVVQDGVLYEDDPSPAARQREVETRVRNAKRLEDSLNAPLGCQRPSPFRWRVDPGDTSIKPSLTGRDKAEVAQWEWRPPTNDTADKEKQQENREE